MFNVTRHPKKFVNFCHFLGNRNHKILNVVRPCVLFRNYFSQVKLHGNIQSRDLLLNNAQCRIVFREKSKGKQTNLASRKRNIKEDESDDDDDDDDEENDEDEYIEDGALVKTYKLNSLRIDLILKQVLKQRRKKIEEFFYNNKIRVNGKVLLKKAENANVGDEIDLIKGISKNNPDFIEVARAEVLEIRHDSDSERFSLRIKMYKSLEIDNYPEGDSWKVPEAEV